MDFYCNHTGSVVIEKKGAISEDGKRQITYAVIDRKGNIGRAERTVTYTDYAETVFSLKAPLRFPMNQDFNLTRYIEAENGVDGDLSRKIKCVTDYTHVMGERDFCHVKYSVTDSTGTTTYLPVIAEFYDPEKEPYTITLTDYLVYVEQGESFDPMAYYEGSDLGTMPEIESDVNTNQPDVYHVTYTVGSEDAKGVSRLVVVVKE